MSVKASKGNKASNINSFQRVVSTEKKPSFSESRLFTRRDLRRWVCYQCGPHSVVMRWFVCLPAPYFLGVSVCENQSGDVLMVSLRNTSCVLMCVCEVSPGFGVCGSDVNSLLSARFSMLPTAVKRARPSLPPPRGLISFFILSAIQLDFLRGHRGQGPFTKRVKHFSAQWFHIMYTSRFSWNW